jgi:hypothetical protein
VHPASTVEDVLALRHRHGLGARRIAAQTGLPVATVRDWLAGRVPHCVKDIGSGARTCNSCGHVAHDFAGLPAAYVYLLGIYLGDGSISVHARGIFRLRITLDARYPEIVDECAGAVALLMPQNAVERLSRDTWIVVSAYSRSWPCLFPQHGLGKKHDRRIQLVVWQQRLVLAHPYLLLRGLIQSDGCRSVNTGRNWAHPRYSFVNCSDDIRRIFCEACDLVGVRYTCSTNRVYVSRRADVALLDQFIGPKR